MHRITGVNNVNGQFTDGPPATQNLPEFMNAVQEELANVITRAGMNLYSDSYSDTKTQLYMALEYLFCRTNQFDIVVTNQKEFNAIVERVSANHYHIKDQYRSVLIRNLGTPYFCSGVLSFLSGGDAWGYLQTNNCAHLKMEVGTYLDPLNKPFYIEANTDDSKIENVHIKVSNPVVTAHVYSFLHNAYRVTFDNCKVSGVSTSEALCYVFCGSSTAGHRYSSKFINCSVYSTTSSSITTLHGFYNCHNLIGCSVHDTSGQTMAFSNCKNVSSCMVYNLIGGANANANVGGFVSCDSLSACSAISLSTLGGSQVYGFSNCHCLSACYAYTIDGLAVNSAYGFYQCTYLSACQTDDIDSAGSVANGFSGCSYGSSLYTAEAANAGNDWMHTNDVQITNKYSCPAMFT